MLAKARYIVLLAVLFGILASYSVYRYLLRYDTMVEAKEIVTEPVLVADRELTAGQEISADDLKLSEWPVEIVPPEHFTSIDEVVGRISRYPLGVGEPVVESRLAPPGALQGLAATIPPGYRAMTVAVNMVSSVSGFVLPGSHVDVLVSMRPAGKKDAVAKTILQYVRVLAVDQHLEGRDGRPLSSRAVTLLVQPDEAEKLGLAVTQGTLQLALRSSTDEEINPTRGVTVASLMNAETKKKTVRRVAKAPAPPTEESRFKVDVIRGTKRSTEELDD